MLFMGVSALIMVGLMAGVRDSRAEGPVITKSFAATVIEPGVTWKIYINASDPDARMKYIFATVEQAGGMAYPLSITRIKTENQNEISGFAYLNTQTMSRPMDFVTLKLIINIRDEKGRFSESAVFPLTFKSLSQPENPPAGAFKETDLGPIMIRLRPVADDGRSSFGF